VSRNKFIADDNRLDKPVLLNVSHLPYDSFGGICLRLPIYYT